MKLIFVWLLAIVFLIDSVLRAIRSSFNLGVLMMYLILPHCGCTLFSIPKSTLFALPVQAAF